ncbi:outer membrane beta-barrel protein [Sinimarinibacterium thermocellulolyticum]|uniref:Outer membrane beta-barrel protein n=1 Tax=Sinimarinibacterium thermocellulolyticum TaxID=3170016 RepID=A0ABV2AAN1_9GAMM
MKHRLGAFLVLAFALLSTAHARPGNDGFVGGSLGTARVDGGEFDGRNEGYKLFLGSQGAVFGSELGYLDLARLGGGRDAPDSQGYTLALSAGGPVTPLLFPYARVGLLFARTEGGSVARRLRDHEPFYGIGLRVRLLPRWSLRAEYERFDIARQDVDLFSAGIELRF